MDILIFGETAEVTDRKVRINNHAACVVEFTRHPNGRISYEMVDRRNPVNRNTINRWLNYVRKYFEEVEGRVIEAA